MSNLLKFNSIIVNEHDKMIIDSNKMVEEILNTKKRNFAVVADTPDDDGFVCGLNAATVEQLVSDETENDNEQSEIIEKTSAEADRIIDEARKEAEHIREAARKEGYESGYAEGTADADKILSDRLTELENKMTDKQYRLEKEYQRKKAEAEPELAEALLTLFEKVIGVLAKDKHDLILHLINSVMENVELSKEFTIHVSESDYRFVDSNRDLIYGASTPDFHIEICKDLKLDKNQCIIETDAGVFDCSLDIQLENLIQEIKILSCIHN